MEKDPTIILKAGREKSILHYHPWIFSGAVERVEGDPIAGSTVLVEDAAGNSLARAAYSPSSQIRARIWTFSDDAVNPDLFKKRLQNSFQMRKQMGLIHNGGAFRMVNAESDGLPGFIADIYDRLLVVQFLSTGAEFWRDSFISLLNEMIDVDCIYERSDVDVRKLEGLDQKSGLLSGSEAVCPVIIQEGKLRYLVDYKHGHKTGFYLDQRQNRQLLQVYLSNRGNGGAFLNCFCYTGAFSVAALTAGVDHLCSIDSSGSALRLARENLSLNGYTPDSAEWIEGDVFQELRHLRDRARSFDAIILDPPKFAATVAQVERAARAYKDINLLAFKLLKPGGTLFTFSCSGGVSADLFQKIVAGAALDAGVDAKIVERLWQSPDHPVSLHFPEGNYLKGLVCQTVW
jgi:23S rRNA (cytosine1962-C5)-methyltransferase